MIFSFEHKELWQEVRTLIVQKKYAQAYQIIPPMIWLNVPIDFAIDIIQLQIKCHRFSEAQTVLQFWLDKSPSDHRLHGLQAQLDYCRGDYQKAKKLYQELLVTAPKEAKYWVNLAYCSAACDDFPAAICAFEKSLTLLENPDPRFYYNYGMSLLLEKEPRRALEQFECCKNFYESDSEFRFNYALAHDLCGLSATAFELYEQNTKKWPHELRHFHNAAILKYRIGDVEVAQKYLNCVLEIEPQHPIAYPLSCALSKKELSTLPSLFIKLLFDQYAFNYDSHLKETLSYQAPVVARQLLAEALPHLSAGVVYDLGCGTGLLAPIVTDIATELIGFDLSEGMLAQAKIKGFYKHLVPARLPQELALCDRIPDYIFAIELSNYLGSDLKLLCQRASELLLPKGLFVLTVETHSEKESYLLHQQARYSYRAEWVRQILEQSQFKLLAEKEAPLRWHEGQAVQGLYLVAERSG